ncbi:EXS-domain-containing protein [Neoconidiobolus thromboides FSU 785]|nr:EXS-domain-containing protein [Neoconidiobolus thromboides FSU 785]
MKKDRILTSIEIIFPVPLRVLFLIFLGPLLYSLNLKGLSNYNINYGRIFNTTPTNNEEDIILDKKLKKIFIYLFLGIFLPSLFYFNFYLLNNVKINLESDPQWQFSISHVFLLSIFLSLLLLLMPVDYFFKQERYYFLKLVYKIIFCNYNSTILFSEVLLADMLTSYSRILGDLFSLTWLTIFNNTNKSLLLYNEILTPLIIAIPFFLRLKQCCIEFFNNNEKQYKHLSNALKYASAFPVIFLSPIISKLIYNEELILNYWLFYLWLVFIMFNSLYSFYWDLVMDWDLYFKWRNNNEYRNINNNDDNYDSVATYSSNKYNILNRELLFKEPIIYYIIVVINLLLRITWVLKLTQSSHINQSPITDFLLELLELFRRFFWIFLRMEKEYLSMYMSFL